MMRFIVLSLLLTGCFTRTIAERSGRSGWFRVDAPHSRASYKDRAIPVPLADPATSCEEAVGPLSSDASAPIVVFVHGVGGEGPEMEDAVPLVKAASPRAVYMLRWVPFDERDAIAARLAAGVSHLADCLPDSAGKIWVIAHSAGGVVSGFAASRMVLPESDEPWVHVVTVASPLAGTVRRAGNADGSQEATFMLDLGSRIARYPAAARGVQVTHLRTSAPADHVMTPNGDLLPNDPRIGVPGAPQVDLPTDLSHEAALHWVVERFSRGELAL